MDPERYNSLLNWEGQLFTVKDEKFYKLLDELRLQVGGYWRDIAREARISTRHLRRIRSNQHATVSYHVMDKILSRLGFPHRMAELPWYTPEQLVEIGAWKPHNTDGLVRYKDGVRHDSVVQRRAKERRKRLRADAASRTARGAE